MFKNRCYNGGNHHNFQARWDERPNERLKSLECERTTMEALKTALIYKQYIRDICTWCGKVIERQYHETKTKNFISSACVGDIAVVWNIGVAIQIL